MNRYEIEQELQTQKYNFLRERQDIILLTLGGSHAYGVDVETSDLDLRGIYLNSPEDILLMEDSQSYLSDATDTTLYSFNHVIKLLVKGNPNVLELLGSKPEHYFILNGIGEDLIYHRKWFFSKKYIVAFNDFADSRLFEIDRLSRANEDNPSIEINKKICKNMYHTLRIYMTGIDLLEKEEIIPYREEERDLLLSARTSEFYKDGQVLEDFNKIIEEYKTHFWRAAGSTLLPEYPNMEEITKFRMRVNSLVVQHGIQAGGFKTKG